MKRHDAQCIASGFSAEGFEHDIAEYFHQYSSKTQGCRSNEISHQHARDKLNCAGAKTRYIKGLPTALQHLSDLLVVFIGLI